MQIYEVDPKEVETCRPASSREIRNQMDRLEVEGQIEPLVVEIIGEKDGKKLLKIRDTFDDWIYGSAQVIAARELEWPTILVTY
jgi:hypothetical protein